MKLGYRYVGPDFRSAGAQTKRINFAANPETFASVANDPFSRRNLNLFDYTRSTNVYNLVLTPQLMAYDPRYSNAMPYGVATPNRKGIYAEIGYEDSLQIISATGKAAMLSDVVGMGSANKRSFQVYQALATLRINKILDWKRELSIYGGTTLENTSRDGNISKVKLNSMLLDGGLDIEVVNKLYLLAGVKMLSAKGNEFIFTPDEFNRFGIPTFLVVDDKESMVGLGLKYKFNTNTYVTFQNQRFSYENKKSVNSGYSFNQYFIMFFMKM